MSFKYRGQIDPVALAIEYEKMVCQSGPSYLYKVAKPSLLPYLFLQVFRPHFLGFTVNSDIVLPNSENEGGFPDSP